MAFEDAVWRVVVMKTRDRQAIVGRVPRARSGESILSLSGRAEGKPEQPRLA